MVPSLVFYDEMLLRYEHFRMYAPILLSRIMGCHVNHEISFNQNAFILKYNIILLYKWSHYKKKYTHNKMSYVFNLGLVTSLDTCSPNGFSLIFKFSLIFMNNQMR